MGIGTVGRAAVFLDRDGVLNPLVLNSASGRMESPLTPEEFQLGKGVMDALQRLQGAGYPLILVSNQPNYALGKCSFQTHRSIHCKLLRELAAGDVHFTRLCYCLHHPKGVTPGYGHVCECRKPSPWFLFRARHDFAFHLPDCWMIGDQATDTQCGRAAGARTIRIASAVSGFAPGAALDDPCADFFAGDLAEAADILLSRARL
jgi:D-glycero-D-manno-heptose 1,7-bisphosphate phosphatase